MVDYYYFFLLSFPFIEMKSFEFKRRSGKRREASNKPVHNVYAQTRILLEISRERTKARGELPQQTFSNRRR